MSGLFDEIFGNGPFDLDREDNFDLCDTSFMEDTFYEDTHGISAGSHIDEEENLGLSEIEIAGLDRTELMFMDADERREALEDAGLDPDDFDDEF